MLNLYYGKKKDRKIEVEKFFNIRLIIYYYIVVNYCTNYCTYQRYINYFD